MLRVLIVRRSGEVLAQPHAFELPSGEGLIGRDPACEVALDSAYRGAIAARHARLEQTSRGVRLTCLSAVPVIVAGQEIGADEHCILTADQTLLLGEFELKVELAGDPQQHENPLLPSMADMRNHRQAPGLPDAAFPMAEAPRPVQLPDHPFAGSAERDASGARRPASPQGSIGDFAELGKTLSQSRRDSIDAIFGLDEARNDPLTGDGPLTRPPGGAIVPENIDGLLAPEDHWSPEGDSDPTSPPAAWLPTDFLAEDAPDPNENPGPSTEPVTNAPGNPSMRPAPAFSWMTPPAGSAPEPVPIAGTPALPPEAGLAPSSSGADILPPEALQEIVAELAGTRGPVDPPDEPSASAPKRMSEPRPATSDTEARMAERDAFGEMDDREFELLKSLLLGLGLSELPAGPGDRGLNPRRLTPELMRRIGELLRTSTDGAVDLLQARATLKHEMRADHTVVAPEGNNPLKFAPDGEAALAHLLAPDPVRGFIGAVPAIRDAFDDLRAHQVGFVAGMRASVFNLIAQFDPAALETRLTRRSVIDTAVPMARRAKLWELFVEKYSEVSRDVQEDFDRTFGEAFVRAYEAQIDELRKAHDDQRKS